MCGFNEFQTPIFVKQNVSSRQLEFKRQTVMSRTKQHSLVLQIDTRLAQSQDFIDDVVRLLVLVDAGDESRFSSIGAIGPQLLSMSFSRQIDDAVRCIQNRL